MPGLAWIGPGGASCERTAGADPSIAANITTKAAIPAVLGKLINVSYLIHDSDRRVALLPARLMEITHFALQRDLANSIKIAICEFSRASSSRY
ncbi:MAG: hypothetical protein WA664_11895 [Candidatus Acidiferrales bacterium]